MLGWIANVALLAGYILIGRRNGLGFLISGCGNVLWGVVGYRESMWSLLSINVLFVAISVYNFLRWRVSNVRE